MKKQLWPVIRVLVPVLGMMMFLIAYLMTMKTKYAHVMIPAYILIVLGFLSILVGFYWNFCHNVMSNLQQRRRCEQSIHIFTIDRPSFFPPSYEECQSAQPSSDRASELLLTVEAVDMGMGLAPPLYSQNGSEDPDCMWSWEQPPQYSQLEHFDMAAEENSSKL